MTTRLPLSFTAVLAASTLLLTGCFLIPTELPTGDRPVDVEETSGIAVGDCWQGEFADYAEWAAWEGDGAVDCDDDHNSYTFFVGEVDSDSDWDDVETTQAAFEVCEPEYESEFGATDADGRFILFFFVSDEDAWDDGDHSVRCDIGISEIGSNYFEPELAELPDLDDVTQALADGDYGLCLVSDGYGPYDDPDTEIADCNDFEYFWRLDSYQVVDDDEDAAYPGDDAVNQFALDNCDPANARDGEESFFYPPTEEQWDQGYRDVECWFSTIGDVTAPDVPGGVV